MLLSFNSDFPQRYEDNFFVRDCSILCGGEYYITRSLHSTNIEFASLCSISLPLNHVSLLAWAFNRYLPIS